MKNTQLVSGALLLAGALVLSGCTPTATVADPSASPSPTAATTVPSALPTSTSPSPTQSAVPTATPTPEPTRPTLDELVVSPEGIGTNGVVSLVIGEKIAVPEGTVPLLSWKKSYCVENGYTVGDPGAGAWVPKYPKTGSGRLAFHVNLTGQARTGEIRTMVVSSSEISTAKGIHPGSTVAQLKAAYPAFDDIVDRTISKLYTVDGKKGRLTFEVATKDKDTPGYWKKSELGTVLWMTIARAGDEPFGIAGTDVGGPCYV